MYSLIHQIQKMVDMRWEAVLVLFLIFSCNSNLLKKVPNTKNLNKNCSGIEKYIKNNWKKNKMKEYYYCESEFLTVIQRDYRRCILSLNKDEITELLGDPVAAQSDEEMTFYYLDEGCLRTPPNNCNMLIFYFDKKKGKVLDYQTMPYVTHN